MSIESRPQLQADAEELKRDLLVSRVVGNILGVALIAIAWLAWRTGSGWWFVTYLGGSTILAFCINALSRWVRERQHLRDLRWAERLRHQAMHDELTGMYNRRHFNARLEEWVGLAAHGKGELCLTLIDVDGLKRINDSLGHAAGDTAIRMTAEAISSVVPATGVAARLGGDEFAVIVCAGTAAADQLAGAIVDAVASAPFARPTGLSVSVGVASWLAGDDGDGLLRRADASLYAEKARKIEALRGAA